MLLVNLLTQLGVLRRFTTSVGFAILLMASSGAMSAGAKEGSWAAAWGALALHKVVRKYGFPRLIRLRPLVRRPRESPQIVAVPIDRGLSGYLDRVSAETATEIG